MTNVLWLFAIQSPEQCGIISVGRIRYQVRMGNGQQNIRYPDTWHTYVTGRFVLPPSPVPGPSVPPFLNRTPGRTWRRPEPPRRAPGAEVTWSVPRADVAWRGAAGDSLAPRGPLSPCWPVRAVVTGVCARVNNADWRLTIDWWLKNYVSDDHTVRWFLIPMVRIGCVSVETYYGFQTVCKCPFWLPWWRILTKLGRTKFEKTT